MTVAQALLGVTAVQVPRAMVTMMMIMMMTGRLHPQEASPPENLAA